MISIIKHILTFRKVVLFSSALILTLLIGFLDVGTGVELSVSLFYIIPIAICSWFINKWSGLFFSLLSAIIWFIADKMTSNIYPHPLIPYWNALILLGFFVTISLILSALRNAMDIENNLAVKVQRELLPKETPVFPGYEVSIFWKPKSFVSGDYYDFIKLSNDRLGICIGDVTGHGVAAALLMSNLLGAVRFLSHQYNTSDKICYHLNNSIFENAIPEKFITFLYGIINHKNNTLEYTNAGHPPCLIIDRHGNIQKLECGGTMIGVAQNHEYKNETIQLSIGDKIIFYTDGLLEAKNISGDMFGEERLIKSCVRNRSLNAEEMSKKIIQSASKFCGGNFDDDITLLIISHNSKR